ncbi:hypothetical protein [Paenibacillus eucommiae]|uniref:Uncharacterized protein n=1 Tax=Paenibacillus eucommiae TaxID=1355755 RepID=A0ABS4JAP8_9BACL|nr:hypothetical protein [Paenibacillus eucommiae]MBP1996923.1 hypothetical protein [Paenibacillus eucommiae]
MARSQKSLSSRSSRAPDDWLLSCSSGLPGTPAGAGLPDLPDPPGQERAAAVSAACRHTPCDYGALAQQTDSIAEKPLIRISTRGTSC